jgi:hypothetical protein
VVLASPSLSKGFSSFDGEAGPGRLQIFRAQFADLLARRTLLVFLIDVEVDIEKRIEGYNAQQHD